MQDFDLIIVGGGLVGASLASALRETDLKIALIDHRFPTCDDPRLFALNIGCCELLTHLGVWPSLSQHATPILDVHVSHQGHFGAVRLRGEALNLDALGHVVPAYQVEIALQDKLNQQPHCTSFRPAQLHAIEPCGDLTKVFITYLEKEIVLSAPIVIGADGSHSTVRTELGFETYTHDYQQSAIVTRVATSRHHDYRAYERFIEEGAIALLPLQDKECALILTINSNKAEALMEQTDDMFLSFIQSQFGFRLGRMLSCQKKHLFPLRMLKVKKPLKDGVYLLGNAAQTLHPIAAQGFNLALYEVALIIEAVQSRMGSNRKFDKQDLSLLWEQTKKQKLISTTVSHHLSKIFLDTSPLVSKIAQLGMVSMTMLPPMKNYFLKKLLGRAGRVPKLLLGKPT